MNLAAWMLSLLAAQSAGVPTISVCGKPEGPVLEAQLDVTVVAYAPDERGTPGNPVARFPNLRVGYGIEATTLPEHRRGEDGGLEPELALFEPLRPDGRYHLPWEIPPGTKLVDDDRWGGWDAWLGNDNFGIGENTLEFVAVSRDRVTVRWHGRIDDDCEFMLEGELPIREVRLSAPAATDVDAVLATVFGEFPASRAQVAIERRVDKWTKEPWVLVLITPP